MAIVDLPLDTTMARAVTWSATWLAKRGLLPPPPSMIPSQRPSPLQSMYGSPDWYTPASAWSMYGSSKANTRGPL